MVEIPVIDSQIEPHLRVALERRMFFQEPLLCGCCRLECLRVRARGLIELIGQELELGGGGVLTARGFGQVLPERRAVVEEALLLLVVLDQNPQLLRPAESQVQQLPLLHPVRLDLAVHEVRETVGLDADLEERSRALGLWR
jgi:hypothetical protein